MQILLSTPTPTTDPASTFYSPGTVGFLAVAFITLAAVLIVVDMVRRIRRVRYRAEIREKLAAEAASDGVKGD
ncbi:MAG: hypothetical protein RIR24_184 [Actinomycetota bacterium]|jgi:uncharacterized membrane protein YcjF (UPF0283 family)